MRRAKVLILFVLVLLFGACSQSWNYKDQKDWGKHYKTCAGKEQSPLDLSHFDTLSYLKPLFIDYYQQDTFKLVADGHLLKLTDLSGSIVIPDSASYYGHLYYLSDIYFHFPSEHTVKGKHYAGELQFLNVDTAGKIMVLAVFIKQGEENPALDVILKNLKSKGEVQITQQIDLSTLLPRAFSYWYYVGSLTFPPCTQNVKWFIMQTPITASAAQIDKFKEVIGGKNRNLQPRNGRKIFKF